MGKGELTMNDTTDSQLCSKAKPKLCLVGSWHWTWHFLPPPWKREGDGNTQTQEIFEPKTKLCETVFRPLRKDLAIKQSLPWGEWEELQK